MSTINYSKWDHIEVSDDEDDTHPNIDTGSLFRWRHQARLERMAEQSKKKNQLQESLTNHQQKMAEMKRKITEMEASNAVASDLEKMKLEMSELEKQEQDWRKKEEEMEKEERLTPWNIDTICHDGKSKTLINKSKPAPKQLSEDDLAKKQEEFQKKYKEKAKKFGMTRRYEDSQQILTENPELVCEETANFLVLWCIELEMEEKRDLMDHVSHQCIIMQFILELAKSLDRDPRSCVRAFFSRIQQGEKQYMDAFNDELESFKERVRKRAKVRIEEALQAAEEEERQARLGPGGLDPLEVMETLPEEMQECFEKKDIEMLKQVVLKLPKEDAEYHMKRCVDSGLWVPGGTREGEQEEEEGAQEEGAQEEGAQEEEQYDEPLEQ